MASNKRVIPALLKRFRRETRSKRQLSFAEAAKIFDVSPEAWFRWESGENLDGPKCQRVIERIKRRKQFADARNGG